MTTVNRPNHLRTHDVLLFAYPSPGTTTAAVAASGTITCGTDAAATDGNSVTVGDGIKSAVTFEYDKSSNGVAGSNTSWAAGTTAASNATALAILIAAAFPSLTVVDGLAGVLTLTHKWPGVGGNVTITKSGSGAVSAVTGLTGGAADDTTGATLAIKLLTADRKFRVEKVEDINPTGLAGHASNYWEIALKKGTTVMAQWSTDSDVVDQGTITANTPHDLVLHATAANHDADVGDVLSLALTKVASAANLPPGRIALHIVYL